MANVWNNITATPATMWQSETVAPDQNTMMMMPHGISNPFNLPGHLGSVVDSNAGTLILPALDDPNAFQQQVSYATSAMASASFYRSAANNPMCTPARSVELLYYGFADLESSITKMLGMADEAQSNGQSNLYSRLLADASLLRRMQDGFLSLMLSFLGPQGQMSINELRALLGGRVQDPTLPNNQALTLSALNAPSGSANSQIVKFNTDRMDQTLAADPNGEARSLANTGVGSLQDGSKVLLERARQYLEMARKDTTQPLTYIAFAMRLLQNAEAFMMVTSIGQGVNPGAGSGFTTAVLNSEMDRLQGEAEQLSLQVQAEQKQGLR